MTVKKIINPRIKLPYMVYKHTNHDTKANFSQATYLRNLPKLTSELETN